MDLPLEMVGKLQQELGRSIVSLEGRRRRGLLEAFLGFSSSHINRASAGYVFLRKSSMVDASKLLIRPAIEAMIRISAVIKQPDLLYRIACSERTESRKLVQPVAARSGIDYDVQDKREWVGFREKYIAHYPDHKLKDAGLSLREAALVADLEVYYDGPYRLYCRNTHAALGAMIDSSITDTTDNGIVAGCVMCALESVVSIGGDAPGLAELQDQLRGWNERKMS